jgi:AcrR family transcriptional regulator
MSKTSAIPTPTPTTTPTPTDAVPPLRQAAAARALSERQASHAAEVTSLIEAAYRLIRRQGVVEPGVREVVAEAGLANRSFYRHFATKDEFWLVLLEDILIRLTGMVAEAMEAQAEPVGRVKAWMATVLDQAVDPDTFLVGRPFLLHGARLREAYPEVYRAIGSALLDLLEGAIREAAESGQVHSPDPRADARSIFHLALSTMQSHVLDRTVPSASERAAVIGFALRALR